MIQEEFIFEIAHRFCIFQLIYVCLFSIRWRGFVDTTDDEVRFRYFIGYFLSSEQGQRLIIDRWESFLNPRCCVIKAEHKGTTRRANHVDLFGYFAGHKVLSEGWLQYDDENQILLRLHGNALKFYKSAKERKNCTVRINPMDVRQRLRSGAHISFSYGVDEEDDEDDANALPYPSHSSISVAVLSDKNPKFRPQPDVGITFNNNKDYVVYKTHSVAVEFLVQITLASFFQELYHFSGRIRLKLHSLITAQALLGYHFLRAHLKLPVAEFFRKTTSVNTQKDRKHFTRNQFESYDDARDDVIRHALAMAWTCIIHLPALGYD
ncbi:unnamed protein product [Cylicostephanus goldi]|uniref:Uncharacterized protein n=1 Tax=Cylicostephanus goldi TaxID=71465 RepID=A0A3P6R529_CYLGO|nr:unnamed protein product [Cylicostephanus goldi]